MFSRKGPIRILQSSSWSCAGYPKNNTMVKVIRHLYIKYKQTFSLFNSIYIYLILKWVCFIILHSRQFQLLLSYECFTLKTLFHKKSCCKPTFTYKSGWLAFQISECELNPCCKPLNFVYVARISALCHLIISDQFWKKLSRKSWQRTDLKENHQSWMIKNKPGIWNS